MRQARELAWQALIRPCREFHDLAALASERSRIWDAIEASGDPANRLMLRTRAELRDTRTAREARQHKLEGLLAMDDPPSSLERIRPIPRYSGTPRAQVFHPGE